MHFRIRFFSLWKVLFKQIKKNAIKIWTKWRHLFPLLKLFFMCTNAFCFLCKFWRYLSEMATPKEKAYCVNWYFETKSIIKIQRKFSIKYPKNPPSRSIILNWHRRFLKIGSVLNRERRGRFSMPEKMLHIYSSNLFLLQHYQLEIHRGNSIFCIQKTQLSSW